MKLGKNNLGAEAERRVAFFLTGQGLALLTQNYHCRFGEIDLVMRDAKTLVFVEVRMRRSEFFGGAAESITRTKQHKIMLTAQHYLQQHGESACRFDVVLMDSNQTLTWIKNAFEAS